MTAASRTLIQRINRFYRMIGTGSVFVWFGLGAVLISATVFPFLRLISPDADAARRRIQRAMQKTFRVYMEMMRVPKLMSYEVHGVERLRVPGRLIVANHPTLIDVVLMVSLIPEIDCIVKRNLWKNPFLRWPVLWASYIPNSEGEELIEACAERIRRGHSLLVFPEGTRTVPGQPMRMQRGAAHVALAADAEILPVTITCTPPTLFKGNPWYRVPERRFHLRVDVGHPMPAAHFRRDGEPSARAARRLTQWLLAYYGESATHRTQVPPETVKSSKDAPTRAPLLS